MTIWTIRNARVSADIDSQCGMMAPVIFTLPSGRKVSPFKVAGWSDRPDAAALPPVLRYIKGDFVCVPYGAPAAPAMLPPSWQGLGGGGPEFAEVHGVGANGVWSLVEHTEEGLRIGIDYPAEHPVKRLERSITLGEDGSVNVDLSIEVREPIRLAAGFHPLFELSPEAGQTRVDIGFRYGRTFPVPFRLNESLAAEDEVFESLAAVPALDGSMLDMTRLPFAFDAEEVVQLCDVDGSIRIDRLDERYTIELSWDKDAFPSCAIWASNGGRRGAPFDGRFHALGVEPVAAAFGLTSAISADPGNPIAREGVPTAIALRPEQTWTTRYRYGVQDLML